MSRFRPAWAFLSFVVLLASASACPDDPGPGGGGDGGQPVSCKIPVIGDPSLPIELEMTALTVDETSFVVKDADSVALITPPQGGRVMFAGVRAKNLDPCAVTLTGSLRDMATNKVMLDRRTVNLKDTGDGFGASTDSDISTFANIPVCPNQWASTDTFDVAFQLTMELTDRTGRVASKTVSVVPRCAEPGAAMTQCTCICKAGYVLGSSCP